MPRFRTIAMYIVCVVLIVVAGLAVLVKYLESAAVFFPSRVMENQPGHMGLAFEDVYFKTSDGQTLNAWLLKAPGASSTVLFAHGNAGNISDRLLKVKFFHDLGLNVLIFDYRGYGKSTGKPSEAGVYLDAQAAYDYLASRADIDQGRVIAYGASLGGVAAIDLGLYRPLAALVIDSSITSAKDMAHLLYPYVPSFLMRIRFDSIHKVSRLTMPKLFMHSRDDQVVPFWMGQRLFEAASEPKEFMQMHGGHNDMSLAVDPGAVDKFVMFLRLWGLL